MSNREGVIAAAFLTTVLVGFGVAAYIQRSKADDSPAVSTQAVVKRLTPPSSPAKKRVTSPAARRSPQRAAAAADASAQEPGETTAGDTGDADTTEDAEADAAEDSEETVEDLKAQFDAAQKEATRLYKKKDYLAAAAQYTRALELCDVIPGYSSRCAALYNNRAAMYEKSGDTSRCLMDCTLCLGLDPVHPLARVRKGRVFTALGKDEEALIELSAHHMVKHHAWQKAMQMGQQAEPPEPPAQLSEVLSRIAEAEVDAIIAAKPHDKTKLPSRYATYEVLHSFESYADLELRFKGVSEAVVTEEIVTAAAGDSPAAHARALMDRGLVRVVKRNYEGATDDITAAYKLLESAEDSIKTETKAEILAWYGTFLHLRQDLAGAEAAYTHALELDPKNADVYIKLAGVAMDNEDYEKAAAVFEDAMNVNVKYGTTYMFRAQVHAHNQDLEAAKADLHTCLELNPGHVAAYNRLITIHNQQGDLEASRAAIDSALQIAPNASDLLLAKGEIALNTAMMNQSQQEAEAAIRLFDKAIAADPQNPVAYLNKAATSLQIMQDGPGAMSLLEKAVSIDPAFQAAYMQLGQVKIMFANSEAETREAIQHFDRAIELTQERDELVQLCTVRAASRGKVSAAKLLGLME